MIDDVMSFVKIAEVLKERGAYKVYVMATHGLLSSHQYFQCFDYFFCRMI